MNLYTQEFTVAPYERGNGKNTVFFLNYLQARYPDKKLIILWDKARYHCGKEVQAYLNTVN
jgi:transposase